MPACMQSYKHGLIMEHYQRFKNYYLLNVRNKKVNSLSQVDLIWLLEMPDAVYIFNHITSRL